ncbi:hypothetical protein SO694_00047289 [Aureococcus anophagefferens]|uniref:Plastid lipid-associated protein/fibrillin conserved domain-containing protein n=1 Tax=Aureococcus anophagefferens TaxID=44056 RepID=A0ABR1G8A8_AURAN|nr:hypothetical protein JL722_2439 [Aureococcus anophagefferens]KAH8070935.1 hypothetical protein JL721_4853 [Aureococcus anophagefferens]KAH8090049.1 hypothetical protein JL720_6346 [Aureococcus anophagefferens]
MFSLARLARLCAVLLTTLSCALIAPRAATTQQLTRDTRRYNLANSRAEDINNSSIIPKIDAYEAVVALARKAKQRALLDQMGDGNLDGVKPLIAQMDEELEQWEADPAYGEMRDQSWPAKIGVVFVDEDNVDTKIAAEAQKFPGEG